MSEAKPRGPLQACQKIKYKNVSGADLLLQKPAADGRKMIAPGGVFISDETYQKLVPRLLHVVEVLTEAPKINLPPAAVVVEEIAPKIENQVAVKININVQEPINEAAEKAPKIPKAERAAITEGLLRQYKEQGKSWAEIARETGYSVTFILKKKNSFGL